VKCVAPSLVAVCSWLLVGCSHGETHDHPTGEVPDGGSGATACDGRGQALQGLEVAAEVDAGGTLTLSFIDGEPMPPIVGNNSWSFRLELDGEPLTDASSAITVTPFMPDHGHGTPTAVNVEEEDAGTYRFEPVHTRMAGYWEMRIDVETDEVSAALVFGVCVE
jgi:hypothetical protein